MVQNIQNFLEKNSLFKVYFFATKKHITEYVLDIENIEEYIERINKSKLVVFSVQDENKNVLISALLNLNVLRKHYSPIIEMGDSKVFYFPQLNYSDIYLLKTLFQQKYVKDTISIVLSKNKRI